VCRPRSAPPPACEARHQFECQHVDDGVRGRWPMLSPEAVSGATRALRCLWHEVCVDERYSINIKLSLLTRHVTSPPAPLHRGELQVQSAAGVIEVADLQRSYWPHGS
jgi:hypothetical protein